MVAVVCAVALVISGVVFSPVKEAKADYNMQQLVGDQWTSLGGVFSAYTGAGNGAVVNAGYDADLNKAKTQQVSGGQWWTWATQVVATYPDLTSEVQAGKKYHISWHIATEGGVSGNVVRATGSSEDINFSTGDLTLEGTLEINPDLQEAAFSIGTMWIPEGVSVIFDNPTITEEQSTSQGPTEQPTEDPSGYGMHKLGADNWESLGGPFSAFTSGGNNANVEVGYKSDVKKAKTKQVGGGNWWTWGSQIAAVFPDLTADLKAGKTFNISWHIYTEGGVSGNVVTTSDSGDPDTTGKIDFSTGDLTLTGTLKDNQDIHEAAWVIGIMWIPEGVSVYYDDPIVKDQSGNIVYPKDAPTTTAAPTTTVAPTTEAPTTTVAPTTEAPSDTTVAPTETQKPGPGPQTTAKPAPKPTVAPKPAKPAKAKVKKATKKKSAKKIKVTLKKIKGAKGYQVKVSKKKNGKALCKKNYKKTKFTIKSKKFKGKKKLYIKARAFVVNGVSKVYGAWSKAKKVKNK